MSEEEGQAADASAAPAPNMKVSELGPYSKQVNATVKVVQKGEARETVSRQDGTTHRVLDALVGDDSGAIYMTLWDDNIDKVNEGDTVNVKNGYVRPFKGSMRLNIGRYGTLEPAEAPLGDVNTQNNLSDKVVEQSCDNLTVCPNMALETERIQELEICPERTYITVVNDGAVQRAERM